MNTKEGSPATTVTDTTAFLAKHADQDYDNALHVRIIYASAAHARRGIR